MRIIGGRLGGRTLLAPKTRDVRPATDRVRESIFNLIEARMTLDGSRILDLFCGTGALGLEAISRGAREATFIEVNRDVLNIARKNAVNLGVESQCIFLRRDARRFVTRSKDTFDLVFSDPPYHLVGIQGLPASVRPLLSKGGLFFLEHDKSIDFGETAGWLESRKYGRTIVSIFEPTQEET